MSYKNTTLTVIQFYTVLFKNHLGPSIINLTLYKTWNFFFLFTTLLKIVILVLQKLK